MIRPKSLRAWLKRAAVNTGAQIIRWLPTILWLRIREQAALVRRMDYARQPIDLCVDSWIEYRVRLHSCQKEPDTVAWIENWFKPGDVFYDIGANVGAYALVAHRFLNGAAQIYAFEPGFVNFPQLCRNVQLNRASPDIIPLQVALAEQNGLINFNYQNLTSGGALHALGEAVDQRGRAFAPVFTLPTLSYRLDDFVQQFQLPQPQHIKIDVDGTELSILKGATATLANPRLRTVLVEMDETHKDMPAIMTLLQAHQLELHSRRHENTLFCRATQET
jgi:FkbM family methyltransferase